MLSVLQNEVVELDETKDESAESAPFAEFAQAVIKGLSSAPKTLPCKFFYDAHGSDLFEQITRLPEYYPTRTETKILTDHADEIAQRLGPGSALVEFGSGSSRKTEILLRAGRFSAYAPIDVSRAALDDAADRIRTLFPTLRVLPVLADFTRDAILPESLKPMRKTGFFPGSTIGNFAPAEAGELLRGMSAMLGRGARLVIGVDLRKDAGRLVSAYDDRQGVTAAFNLNLLARMKRELGARLDLSGFAHHARYDEALGRIEMHLVSLRAQTIEIAGEVFHFAAGETIHTENSYKYSDEDFAALAEGAGWRPLEAFTDANRLFSVRILEAV